MTALTQPRRTFAYRLPTSLTVAFVITIGLALAMLTLIAGSLALPGLTDPLFPYAPGGPDLRKSLA